MNVKEIGKTDRLEIRHSVAIIGATKNGRTKAMPKPPTARMKIISGRPYYYAIENIWNKEAKTCRQVSRYLGKGLPKGYRLIK